MEDLDEVRTKRSDYVKESSNPDEFKEVDQASDVEKKNKMVDVEGGVSYYSSADHSKKAFDPDSDVEKKKMVGVEGGVSCSSDDHFKKVDQDSDVENKKMVDVEGGVSYSSDDHFKKVDQDSDLEKKKWKRVEQWDEARAEGLETQILTLLDDMKFMVSRTTDMIRELKALGN